MSSFPWQPSTCFSTILFDCDGTLSTIEGIDTLADSYGVGTEVQELTAEAMGTLGMNHEIYHERLNIVKPTQDQVINLGHLYYVNRMPEISEVIHLLQRLNKTIYIISAGLYPAVKIFGELLKVPKKNIIAVDIQFDIEGNYQNFDHHSPLVNSMGKREIIASMGLRQSVLVGDGLNDLVAKDVVTRFIGFGGKFYRQNIEANCEYYIKTPSMSALLPLVLTQEEYQSLKGADKKLYESGLNSNSNY